MAEVKVHVFFDGGKRSKDTPAAASAVILTPEGDTLTHHAMLLDVQYTSNDAEYQGLLIGLRAAQFLGATDVAVFGDSNLVIQHLWGEWTHDAKFEAYHREARELIASFKSCVGTHVRRGQNAGADALCNDILDGEYVPYGEEPASEDAIAATLSFMLTLRLPKSRVQNAAGSKRVRSDLEAAIAKAFPVASVTVTRL